MELPSYKIGLRETPAYKQVLEIPGAKDVDEVARPFLEALEAFVDCEVIHRRSGRATALELPKGEYYERLAMMRNAQGLRALERARTAARKLDLSLAKRGRAGESDKETAVRVRQALDERDLLLGNQLMEMDLPAEEVKAIWTEHKKLRAAFDEGGDAGLVTYTVDCLDKLAKMRENLTKGRQHASPLEWWKYFVIPGLYFLALAYACLETYANDQNQYFDSSPMTIACSNETYRLICTGC